MYWWGYSFSASWCSIEGRLFLYGVFKFICLCLFFTSTAWGSWLKGSVILGWLACPSASICNSLSLSFSSKMLPWWFSRRKIALLSKKLGAYWEWNDSGWSVLEAFVFLFQKAWGRSSSDLYFSYDWWFYLRALQSIVEYYVQQKKNTDTWISNIIHPNILTTPHKTKCR